MGENKNSKININWYPGHMTKARRMMEENIKLVDLVIEIIDAALSDIGKFDLKIGIVT